MAVDDACALTMTCPPQVYRRRRTTLGANIQRPMLVCAGYAQARNYIGNDHYYRAGSTYLYLGGPPLQGSAWIIEPGNDGQDGCRLIRPTTSPDDVVWFGSVPADDAMASAAGIDPVNLDEPSRLQDLLGGRTAGVIAPPCVRTHAWTAAADVEAPRPDEIMALVEQRLFKDEHELAAMRRAASVTVEAHQAAMAATRPGRGEADVAAAFMAVLVARQCQPSFSPIATVNGQVLHPNGYQHPLQPGRLLLVDAGAEEPGGYACDATRTFPVEGKWSAVQRQLYDTVLRAQRESIAACVPGRRFRDVHDLAGRVICQGLVEAGLLRGDPADLAGRYAHTLFFVHGLGHLIGLDVHDMEDFGDLAGYAAGRKRRPEFGNKFLRLDRDLQPGMTVTIEPGIYLVPAIWQRDDLVGPFKDVINRPAIDALLEQQFGGIRIEEVVCIRQDGGPEVLTADLPNQADAVVKRVGCHA
ncbi:MAG: aminopeptidase P N-terminal domain-containing protein [Phycisphaerae bacterium]